MIDVETTTTFFQWFMNIMHMVSPIKYPLLISTIGYLIASIITYNAIRTQDQNLAVSQQNTPTTNQQQQQENRSRSISPINGTPSPNDNFKRNVIPRSGVQVQQVSRSESGSPASGEVVVTSTIVFPKTKIKKSSSLIEQQQHQAYNSMNSPTNKGRSSGEHTRRYFYKLLFISLITRLIFIQLEAMSLLIVQYEEQRQSKHPQCSDSVICILSRTFPGYTYASALSLLVLFYGQLAGTASIGGPTGLSLILTQNKHIFPIGNAIMYGCYSILFLLHLIFSRPHTRYVTYDTPENIEAEFNSSSSIIVDHEDHEYHEQQQYIQHVKATQHQLNQLSLYIFQRCTWCLLLVVYGILLALLSYFGPILVIVLRPSLAKWSGLALRLISMCVLCTIIFITRMLSFAFACYTNDIQYTCGFFASYVTQYLISDDYTKHSIVFFYTRDIIGYMCYELFPTYVILFMMHHRTNSSENRRYPQSSGSSTPNSANTTSPSNYILPTKHIMSSSSSSYNNNYNNAIPNSNFGNTYTTNLNTASSTSSNTNFMRRNISGSAPKGINTGHRIMMIHKNAANDEIKPLLDHNPQRGYGI